jgi:murein DD-endopeptidase MepM/ murein hydrolase activator NlpD
MMMRIAWIWTAIAAGLATVGTGARAPAQDTSIQLTHHARALAPGEVVLVTARTPTPLQELRAEWLGQTVLFFQAAPGRWEGLAPIDLSTPAGRYSLRLAARTDDGRALAQTYPIAVARRTFPTRRITVDEKFVDPPDDVLPRIERERKATEAIFAAATPERFWTDPFIVPVPGAASSSFGRRSIVNGQPRSPHSGTDFQAATGTPVSAPNRGRVALAADLYFPGLTIIIDHGGGTYSYLAHLSELMVAEGAIVERGQRIALSGATGRVTGPHLHWTLRLGRARVDPLSLVSVLKGPAAGQPTPPRKRAG